MSETTDFDAWLAGATLAQSSVEVLQDGGLLARWDDLRARWERAEKADAGERSISDADPLAELEIEARELLSEIEASRTVFVVRGLLPSDVKAIRAAHPVTDPPRFTGKVPGVTQNPTEAQAKAYLGMWESYQLQRERWEADNAEAIDAHQAATAEALLLQGAERIARATVRIEQAGQVIATRITAEQVVQLADRIGDPQIKLILAAIQKASEDAPEVSPSFLSRHSGSDRG